MANGLSDFFLGSAGREHQFQRFNPQQQAGFAQQLSQGLSNSNFQGIEDRARQQFTNKTIPGIAERFTALGNDRNSSAFQGALGSAGSDLESQLAQLRSNYGLQQLQYGFQPQFENAYFQRQPGFLENAGVGFSQGLGQALPGLVAGAPWGKIGSGIYNGAQGAWNGIQGAMQGFQGMQGQGGQGQGGMQGQGNMSQLFQLLSLLRGH